MTSLQTTLLIVAVVAIAAVLIYNFLQGRKVNQRIERSRAGMAAAHTENTNKERAEPVLERFTMPGPEADSSGLTAQTNGFEAASNAGQSGGNGLSGGVTGEFDRSGGQGSGADQEHDLDFDSTASGEQRTVTGPSTKVGQTNNPSNTPSQENNLDKPAIGDAWMLRSYGLNPVADCIVDLPLRDPLSGERILSLTSSIRRVGSKPIIFEGQNEQGEWEPIVTGERFVSLRAGVLLANRHGALNAMEFSDFASYMQKLADHFEIHANVPEMQSTLQRARQLDAQCADLDAQIGLNIIASEALSTSDLSALASEFGLTERGNNRFSLMGEHQEALFSVALGDAPNRLNLLLDVPRAPSAANPWARMLDCAQRCVARFGGRLVDDADKPLNKEALERIGSQLAQRYQSLSEASMVAGSPVALRLFN
jgi:ZipA, C-terminal FtsZ-binding domain